MLQNRVIVPRGTTLSEHVTVLYNTIDIDIFEIRNSIKQTNGVKINIQLLVHRPFLVQLSTVLACGV